MTTRRLTVGQALVEFLAAQWTVDGDVRERPLLWSARGSNGSSWDRRRRVALLARHCRAGPGSAAV